MKDEPILQIGLFDELEALYPDTHAANGEKTYRISSASGSYAGVHIMISGVHPGECITFEVKGPHRQYKLFELVPVPVEENTGIESRTELLDGVYNPYTIRRAPFMIYEALKPMRNILLTKASTVAVAFREQVSVTEMEEHQWEIYVTAGQMTQKVTFIVEAYPVKVPVAGEMSHKYVNWISLSKIAEMHHAELWSPRWEALVLSYFKLAQYARQNVAWFQGELYFEVDNQGEIILNTKKLDKLIELAQKAGLYYFQGAALGGRKDGDWMASEGETILTRDPIPGRGETTLATMASQLEYYLQDKGIKNRWIQSFFDEPLDVSSEVYKRGVAILKQAMPGTPILEANKATTTIAGSLTDWCPTVDCFEKDLEFYKHRLEIGDRVWVYTCLEPTGPYLNRLLDMERIRTVLFGWVAALYPVEGFLHWGGNHFSVNPYEQSCVAMMNEEYTDYNIPYHSELPAGDCGVFYPGFNGAISCIRLEGHRMGFEDLELIKVLNTWDEKEAVSIVQEIARGYKDYETDIPLYRKAKARLLKAVNQL